MAVNELLKPHTGNRYSFELYRSAVCHRVKETGDIGFIMETLEQMGSGELPAGMVCGKFIPARHAGLSQPHEQRPALH